MPKYKRKGMRKRFGRKRFVKRKGYKTNNNMRSLNPIPQRYICKMKYSETVSTSASGVFDFNLNSIFDPNRSGTGHQPYGHDTLQTLYNRYRVIACSWRINMVTSSGATPRVVGAIPANEVISFAGGIDELRENPRAKYICQNPGGGSVVLSGKTYIPSLVGRTKIQYMADDRYQAVFGTNPQEGAILNILTTDGGNTPTSTQIQVVLEYTVEVFDVKHLSQS